MSSNDQVFLEEVLKQRRDELSDPISESDYFELFASEQALKDYDLSWEEIESGIVGAGGDGGIDGFYLFVNGDAVPVEMLVINTGIVGNYFGTRGAS